MFKSLVSTIVNANDRLLALTSMLTLKIDLSLSTYDICATIFSVDHICHISLALTYVTLVGHHEHQCQSFWIDLISVDVGTFSVHKMRC